MDIGQKQEMEEGMEGRGERGRGSKEAKGW